MKTFRNLVILAGFSVALVALGVTGAKAQSLSRNAFSGSFTLPFQAQWGAMTLPAGDYTLHYGRLDFDGPRVVEIAGTTKGSPHGLVLVQISNPTTATKNAIVCIREGSVGIVRALDLPAIGESIDFKMPHGVQLMAKGRNSNTNTLLAGGPMLFQRIPVTVTSK